jgi:hypothetical protein
MSRWVRRRHEQRRLVLDVGIKARAAFIINQGVRELGLRLERREADTVVFERVRPDRPYPNEAELMEHLLYSLAQLQRRFPEVKAYLGAGTKGILIA